MNSINRKYLCVLSIALISFAIILCYLNSLSAPFFFDDIPNITTNNLLELSSLTPSNIFDFIQRDFPNNRPLAYLSFAINKHYGEFNVFGYHVVNIGIHIIVSCLLFFFLLETFTKVFRIQNALLISFFSTLLWAVHPIQTQSVTYIVQRMNSMAVLFYLLGLISFIRIRLTENGLLKLLFLLSHNHEFFIRVSD